jgi:uncharacterized protein YbgA (DUF1722 family)/uncharacterized protein YbbK (DUF523 family)
MDLQDASPGKTGDANPPRPVVVVSECLGFGAVRYNGQILQSRFVEGLRNHVDFVHTCPEVGIGLGVPRDPVRLVEGGGRLRMVQPATSRDVTGEMEGWSRDFLGGMGAADGFILKSRSPSCGIGDVRVYASEDGPVTSKGAGLFARAVLEAFPLAAVEDDGRLTNLKIRHHFLTTLFTVARFRAARQAGTMKALVHFQTEHKLLLMGYGQEPLRRLGRIVANAEGRPAKEVFERYAEALGPLLRKPARPGPIVNVLQHAFGYLSDDLSPRERKYFLELVQEYRDERLPLAALLAVLRAWIVRVGVPYLEVQRFFEPFPRDLLELTDSGLRSRI